MFEIYDENAKYKNFIQELHNRASYEISFTYWLCTELLSGFSLPKSSRYAHIYCYFFFDIVASAIKSCIK